MKVGLIVCILPCTLGLISAAPLFGSSQYGSSHRNVESYEPLGIIPRGDSPWFAAVSGFVGNTVGSRILNNVIDCHICGKCSVELQQDTDIEDRSAKVMALVQVMDKISAAKETLNAVKKFSMKDGHIQFAGAQFNELANIHSIEDALGNAGDYLKGSAKRILCG